MASSATLGDTTFTKTLIYRNVRTGDDSVKQY